jgi:hypothetical protein
MMASKDDDNKRKYAADTVEEEMEPKKQKMIDDDNGNDIDDDDNDNDNGNDDDDDSSSTDNYLSELKEEVSSGEKEMNLPNGFEEELLIRQGCSDDGDTSDGEEGSHFFSDDD